MTRTNFENLQVYQLAEKLADEIWGVERLKPILNELSPRLNAYLKSIGRIPKSK